MSIMMKFREPVGETFSVAVAGDFCPRGNSTSICAAEASNIVKNILPVYGAADIRLLNWETAIDTDSAPIAKSGPNLRCSSEALEFARALKAQVLMLANNHTGDYGGDALLNTIEECEKSGFATVGAGADAEAAAEALIVEAKGIKLAILNACEHEFGFARRNTPGTCGMDLPLILEHIRELKKQKYLVMVTLHGGHENFPAPSPRMVKLFRALADGGADAVFNTHTHCPLGCEIHNGIPIVGSCGNFYFPTKDYSISDFKPWHLGYLPVYSFDSQGAWQLELTPYLNMPHSIELFDENDEADFKSYFSELCRPFEDMEYCENLFDSWCWSKEPNYYFQRMFEMEKPENGWDFEAIHKQMMPFRNLLNCESHCDILRNCMLIIEEKRCGSAGEYAGKIQELRALEWLKLTGAEK